MCLIGRSCPHAGVHYVGTLETRSNTNSGPAFSEEREKAWLALLLGWAAGFVDAFGYLLLNNIFTSHISGNSVSVGALLAVHHWTKLAMHAYPILFFTTGFFAGAVLENTTRRLRIRRRFSVALAIETALLVAFLAAGKNLVHAQNLPVTEPGTFILLIALLACAMGVQAASLRRVRGQSVHTPFVTGMLMQSIENGVLLLFHGYDRLRNQLSPEDAQTTKDCFGRLIFYGALWFSFLIGAVCGGFGEVSWHFMAMLVPLAVLAFVMICDIMRPIYD